MKESFRVPILEPDLSHLETKYVLQALENGWVSSQGENVKTFESRFAAIVNGFE